MKGLPVTPVKTSLLLLFTCIVLGIVAFSGTATAGPTLDEKPAQNGMLLPPGDLDTTFDGDGKLTTDFLIGAGGSFNDARAVAIQPDGKIVTAGTVRISGFNYNFGVTRYNANGSLDTDFSADGRLTTDFGHNDYDAAFGIAVQADSKIIVVGVATGTGDGNDFGVARYNTDGSLDDSFDGDGRAIINFGTFYNDWAHTVAIQADGKIVVAGYSSLNSLSDNSFAIARLNINGSLDNSFDGDGRVGIDFFGGIDRAYGVGIQGDGKIVTAGSAQVSGSNYDHAIVRLNINGSLDSSFDGDGKVTTDFFGQDDGVTAMAIQADGRIVTAGSFSATSTGYDFGLARYLYNGALDPDFDNDGLASFNFAPGVVEELANGVAIQTDGKIVAAGYAQGAGQDFALARLNSNGSLDNTFSGDGKLTTDIAGANDIAYAVALQADGKIVAAGTGYMGSYNLEDFALTRYISSDPPAPTPTFIPTNTPLPTPTACPIQFTDVPEGSSFYSFVRCMACRGIINGYSSGCETGDPCFRPNNNITRGQLSKIVANAANFTEPAGAQQFEDVAPGSTFYDFVWRLFSRGILNGYPCGGSGEPCVGPSNLPYFRPNANVTRGQLAKIVSEGAGITDPPVGQQFEDVPVGSTFYTWIWRLANRAVIGGYQCGGAGEPCVGPSNLPYFRPGANATRGQASKIVSNTFFPGCVTPYKSSPPTK